MIPESMNHLSDEVLDDILIGLGSSAAESHLAECPLCRGKVEDFRSGLDKFNQTTLAWSEARSNAMGQVQIRRRLLRFPFIMGWALAAAVLLTIAIPVWRGDGHSWSNPNIAKVAPPQDSQTQIAEDNELLKAVNSAIDQDDESLNNEYQLLERPHPRLKTRPE